MYERDVEKESKRKREGKEEGMKDVHFIGGTRLCVCLRSCARQSAIHLWPVLREEREREAKRKWKKGRTKTVIIM